MKLWSIGDRVVHTGKPEWGAGGVKSATKTTQDGRPCQLLSIRFDRAGLKTISTAFANLIPAEEAASLTPEPLLAPSSPNDGESARHGVSKEDDFTARLMGGQGTADIKQAMTRLPDAATDPFTTPLDRLKATLALYRFQPTGGSLLDWAAMQSGLADPMSRFNRHELEKFFESFVIVRDNQLRKVAGEARKLDPNGASGLMRQAPASAQQALRRLDGMR
jgi:hypothetical protein